MSDNNNSQQPQRPHRPFTAPSTRSVGTGGVNDSSDNQHAPTTTSRPGSANPRSTSSQQPNLLYNLSPRNQQFYNPNPVYHSSSPRGASSSTPRREQQQSKQEKDDVHIHIHYGAPAQTTTGSSSRSNNPLIGRRTQRLLRTYFEYGGDEEEDISVSVPAQQDQAAALPITDSKPDTLEQTAPPVRRQEAQKAESFADAFTSNQDTNKEQQRDSTSLSAKDDGSIQSGIMPSSSSALLQAPPTKRAINTNHQQQRRASTLPLHHVFADTQAQSSTPLVEDMQHQQASVSGTSTPAVSIQNGFTSNSNANFVSSYSLANIVSSRPSDRWPSASIVEPLEPLDNESLFLSADLDIESGDDDDNDANDGSQRLTYARFLSMSVAEAMTLVQNVHKEAIVEFRKAGDSDDDNNNENNQEEKENNNDKKTPSRPGMNSWNFDAFDWAQHLGGPMVLFEQVALFVARKWEIFRGMQYATVDKEIFINFLRKLGPLYRDVPFHTQTQAADRLQAVYFILNSTKPSLLEVMNGLERTALLISALAADVGHPGRNNAFLNNIRDPVAVRYNSLHVLENYHIATLFSTLRTKETDITQDLKETNDLAAFHNQCCSYILSTELARNKFQVDDFEKRITSGALDPLTHQSHRQEVLGLLLHTADISNPARPSLVASKWSRAVQLEFEAQGDDEESRGLTISQGMGAGLERAKVTVEFIDSYTLPLFEAVGKLMKKENPPLIQLTKNRSVLAAQVGVGSQVKSRWPESSIVTPLAKTNWETINNNKNKGETKEEMIMWDCDLRKWSFDAFAEAEKFPSPAQFFEATALRIADEMMLFTSDSSTTGIFDREKFKKFVNTLASYYRPNPYHSLYHAADVTQGTFALLMMTNPPLLPRMDGVERAALLLSALAHDVGHPGRNNMFLNKIRDPVAVRYNGQSVLENFHAQTLFSLIRDREVDITEDLSTADLARFHSLVCTFILGTDMANHKIHVDDFDHRITSGALRPADDANHRKETLAVLLHAADIGNPTRIPEISAKWDQAVQDEFLSQGDEEIERGLPVSPGCARGVPAKGRAGGTLFFVDNYVLPLFEALAKIMRPDAPVVDSLLKNRSAIADSAGLPQIQKSRWPTTSLIEPIQIQQIKMPPLDATNQLMNDENLYKWNSFDAFQYAENLGSPFALFEQLAVKFAQDLDIFSTVKRSSFRNFLRKLGPMYRDLPYHNLTQAADRTQAIFSLLSMTEPPLLPKLDVVERTALLVVALGSDVGHPGRTNSFLVAIRDPVAIRYNRKNVLENFHAATLFSILRENSCDITMAFTEEQLDRFHDLACSFIMSTDLGHSTAQIKLFQQRLSSGSLRPHENAEDRKEVLSLFLHTADISNPARPALVSAKWTRRVQMEFEAQGDEELRRGLPVSPGMSRDCDRAKFLVRFMEAFTLPLFEAVGQLLVKKADPVENMIANHAVLAAQAGMDVAAKSRWVDHSIVEPLVLDESFDPSIIFDSSKEDVLPIEKLKQWNFDAFDEAEALESPIAFFEGVATRIADEMMLFKSDASATGLISRDKFVKFVRKLGRFYRPTSPYHNVVHAADVTQGTFALLMMTNPPLLPRMDGVERAALLLSALAHDVGHPGRNNMFLNNIRDPVAVRYNGQSVLENFHAQTLFSLIRDREVDITEDLSAADLARFHSLVCTFILGTDMAKHKIHVDDFDHRITSGALRPADDANHRKETLAVLLHAADIGNPTRPPIIASKWDRAVQQEFLSQGDEEIERGLPVSPGCSRNVDAMGRARGTLFFVDNYVLPLFEALAKIMRPDAPVVDSLIKNRTAIAANANLPQIQRSRWSKTSILEPLQIQNIPSAAASQKGRDAFTADLTDWHFDSFYWSQTVGSQYLFFEQMALRVADDWKIFSDSDMTNSQFESHGNVDRAAFGRFIKKLGPLYRDVETDGKRFALER